MATYKPTRCLSTRSNFTIISTRLRSCTFPLRQFRLSNLESRAEFQSPFRTSGGRSTNNDPWDEKTRKTSQLSEMKYISRQYRSRSTGPAHRHGQGPSLSPGYASPATKLPGLPISVCFRCHNKVSCPDCGHIHAERQKVTKHAGSFIPIPQACRIFWEYFWKHMSFWSPWRSCYKTRVNNENLSSNKNKDVSNNCKIYYYNNFSSTGRQNANPMGRKHSNFNVVLWLAICLYGKLKHLISSVSQ